MPTNQYLPFGTAAGANTLSTSAYATGTGAALRGSGYVAGVADAMHINTALRQASVAAAGVGSFAAQFGTLNVNDDGSPDNFAAALKSAMDALIGLAIPPGITSTFAGSAAPAGWLVCDGSTVSQATYPRLFAAIGLTYNIGGEDSSLFRLPDARGAFLRGLDSGRGLDPSRGLGTLQTDDFKAHGHLFLGDDQATSVGYTLIQNLSTGFRQDQVGGGDYKTKPDPSTPGGNETRPVNLSQLIIIKT